MSVSWGLNEVCSMMGRRNPKMPRGRRAIKAICSCAALIAPLSAAFGAATNTTWKGPSPGTVASPTTGGWNTAGNWTPGAAQSDDNSQMTFGGSGSTAYTSTNDISSG